MRSLVVRIPKECILSIKTTGIANLLDEANLEGGCPLALAVLYEIAQGEQSPWYGYLQALPEHGEDLPIFWEEQEKDWFHGTEMESAVHNDLVQSHTTVALQAIANAYSLHRLISKTITRN